MTDEVLQKVAIETCCPLGWEEGGSLRQAWSEMGLKRRPGIGYPKR